MKTKLNKVYKSGDGEYFKSVEKNGEIVLSNPSYPFVFLPRVLEPLEEIGDVVEFEHLIKQEEHQFIEGETLTVKVTDDGNLEAQQTKQEEAE